MATWATAKRAVPGGVHGSRQPRCCDVDPDKDDNNDESRQWRAWLGSKVGSIWTRIALPFFLFNSIYGGEHCAASINTD